jgi:TPR repeat protein
MKTTLIAVVVVLLALIQSPAVLANEAKQMRAKAEQYYADLDYKKAFKTYRKLAQSGDRYSQRRLSHMYAEGQGKSVDLVDSYAWAALAAEGNDAELAELDETLLPQIEKPEKAQKEADKLIKKYGKEAQKERIARYNKQKRGRVVDEGSCTGSKLACPRR